MADIFTKSSILLVSLLCRGELGVCHPYGLVRRVACDLPWIFVSLCFSLAFFSYSPKSSCFTCYTSLYLLNYAYRCARMSSNEMLTFLLGHAR
jgi:hypothetical protein